MIPALVPVVALAKRIPAPVWYAAGLVLALVWYGANRYSAGREYERGLQAKAQAIAVDAVRKQTSELERKERARLELIGKRLERENANAIRERDSVIAGLRDGSSRLRERFKCPPRVGALPETAAAPGGSHAGEEAGLSNADAEFLIRFASEADAVAIQLGACQAAIPKP